MWDELKGLGGFLFFIGCIITWVAFLAPHINPTWIANPYEVWQWGILLVGAGIGVFVLAWVLGAVSGVRFRRGANYYGAIRGDRKSRRIAKLVALGVVLTIIAWVVSTYGPQIFEALGSPSLPEEDLHELQSTYTDEYVMTYLKGKYSGQTFKLKTVSVSSDWESRWEVFVSSMATTMDALPAENDAENVAPLEENCAYETTHSVSFAWVGGSAIKATYNDQKGHTEKVTIQISETSYYQNPNPGSLRYTASSTKDNAVFSWPVESGVDFYVKVMAEPIPISDYYINLGSGLYDPAPEIHLVGGNLEHYNLGYFDLTGTLAVENGYDTFHISKVEPLSLEEVLGRIT